MKEFFLKNNIGFPKIGNIVEGQVVGKARSSLFLDLGAMGTGIIYGKEFYEAKGDLKNLKIGDKVSAKIVGLESEKGYIELSLKQAEKEIAWKELKEKKEKGETIEVKISGANKGGLLADVSGIAAFLPVSQLSSQHYPKVENGDKIEIFKKLQNFINKSLRVKILAFSPEENKLILSEKAKDIKEKKELLEKYKVGDVVKGEVTGIVDFGAFIKFPIPSKEKKKSEAEVKEPGVAPALDRAPTSAKTKADEEKTIEGLCHISELDWQLIENPSQVVKTGDKVKAKIIDISNDRVSLSLKALKKDPWEGIEKKFKKDDVVKGRATKFNPFGAFVQITPKIQGLIHISEFGSEKNMTNRLELGKEYDFQILFINPEKHWMALKLKDY